MQWGGVRQAVWGGISGARFTVEEGCQLKLGVAAAAGVQSTQQAVGRQGIGHSATHRSRPRLRDALRDGWGVEAQTLDKPLNNPK